MSDKSPLFSSSVELLAHSIELFAQGNERKYKFVILHLANAIELIFKDRLIDKGVSIYENNSNRTITVWAVFTELGKVNIKIPERPVIELLIDDRNTIQHRFGFPNTATVFYYLEQVIAFFKRFLFDEYGVDIAEVLKLYVSENDLALFGLSEKPKEKDIYESLDDLFRLSPESAIVKAFNLVESKFLALMPEINDDNKSSFRPIWQSRPFSRLLEDLVSRNFLTPETASKFYSFRDVRNRSAHHPTPFDDELPNKEMLAETFKIAKEFISGLDKAIESGYYSAKETDKDTSSQQVST